MELNSKGMIISAKTLIDNKWMTSRGGASMVLNVDPTFYKIITDESLFISAIPFSSAYCGFHIL
jgi:hypothetical protein